jgi:hypothetical protein
MSTYGRFVGDVITQWLDTDRQMKLLEDFLYVDASGRQWKAPKGFIIDGASIPRLFWPIVGSPFDPRFRKASVVHDVACVEKTVHWQDVHRMFYYACLCDGLNTIKAKVMYAAVFRFGPRWDAGGAVVRASGIRVPEDQMIRNLESLRQVIESENPSLERVEQLAG